MGLLKLRGFSSIPTLKRKIQSRREQKERYSPTWAEWATENQEQVIRQVSVNVATTVFFTVDPDRLLFITSAWISTSSATNTTDSNIHFGPDNVQNILVNGLARAGSEANVAVTFNKPIRVDSGVTVSIRGAGIGTFARGGFTGFLTPKSKEIV